MDLHGLALDGLNLFQGCAVQTDLSCVPGVQFVQRDLRRCNRRRGLLVPHMRDEHSNVVAERVTRTSREGRDAV